MILSAGKFFKNLFQKKQRPQNIKPAPTVKREGYGILDSLIPEKKVSRKYISAHNMGQSGKAKRKLKTRKANKLARKQRKLNAKGGKS